MSETNRPFDFEADARSDFATGTVPAARDGHPRSEADGGRDPEPDADPRRDRHRVQNTAAVELDRHGGRVPGYLDDHPDGGYDDARGGYDDGRGGYDDPHDGYDDARGGYDDGRGGYDDPHDGYDDHDDYDDPAEIEPEPTSRRSRRRGQADSAELLQRVIDIVSSARSLPLSASASINRDEVLELLEEAQQRLPVELREARWLRKEREDYLEKMRSDGDEIIGHARDRVEQMVQRTEIAKAAEHRARRIIENAEAEARRMRLETEDYCDHHLARFEIILERTLKVVGSGRSKLQTTGVRSPHPDDPAPNR